MISERASCMLVSSYIPRQSVVRISRLEGMVSACSVFSTCYGQKRLSSSRSGTRLCSDPDQALRS